MYHSFLIHSSADRHLGCVHVLAITNSAVMNTFNSGFLGMYPREMKKFPVSQKEKHQNSILTHIYGI